MKRKPTVLLLCRETTDTGEMVQSLARQSIETTVVKKPADAVVHLRDSRFDMVIAENRLDGASGLTFLQETRKHLPQMLRVILEIEPITLSWHKIINDVAPAAIFEKTFDSTRIVEILHQNAAANEGDPENDGFILQCVETLGNLISDPNLQLPVLPEIARHIDHLLVDESNSFKEIAAWVQREPSIAARILQVANSPIYCALSPIHNLQQAVTRLGLRATRQILQAVIAESLFRSKAASRVHMMRYLWLHSLSTAYGNEAIAQDLEIPDSEDYFMMGLLHDIGKLLILHLVEFGRRRNAWRQPISDEALVKMIVSQHNEMGARLVDKWAYAKSLRDVVRRHNDPHYARFHSEPIIVTHLSNLMTHKLGYSFAPHDAAGLSRDEIAQALNMSAADQQRIELSVIEAVERVRHSCFVDPFDTTPPANLKIA